MSTATLIWPVAEAPGARSEIVHVTVWPLTLTHEPVGQFDIDEDTSVRPDGSTSVTTTWPESAVLLAALAAVSVNVSCAPTSGLEVVAELVSETFAEPTSVVTDAELFALFGSASLPVTVAVFVYGPPVAAEVAVIVAWNDSPASSCPSWQLTVLLETVHPGVVVATLVNPAGTGSLAMKPELFSASLSFVTVRV